MLEPYFFQCEGSISEGTVYKVTGYARVNEYTLVTWRLGGEENWTAGEDLYHGRKKIAGGGGELDLFAPASSNSNASQPFANSIWTNISFGLGNYGIPCAIAIALRDPLNYTSLE